MKLFGRARGSRGAGGDLSLEYMVSDLNRIREANRLLETRVGGRPFGPEFAQKRTSDTLFILGSGPSINELDDAAFARIGQADSIGFNFWLAHEFVPSFFMFQMPPVAGDPMLTLARRRRQDYANVPFLFRGSRLLDNVGVLEGAAGTVFDPEAIWLLNEFPIHSKCEIDVDRLITFVENLGFFSHGTLPEFLVKWRGTLGLLISFGWNMGYKRIVLCGIDMTKQAGGSHFYDAPAYDRLRREVDLPDPTASDIASMMDEGRGRNTVAVYVERLAAHMKSRAGVELMVATKNSALHPLLPLWRPDA